MDRIRKLISSLGGRRFLLTIIGAVVAPKLIAAGVEPEIVWTFCGLIVSFVLGESFRDGMSAIKGQEQAPAAQSVSINTSTQNKPGESQTMGFKMNRMAILAIGIGALFMTPGCFSRPQAANAVASMEVSAIQYSKNMNAMVGAFIADYRENALSKIDDETDAALRSVTKPDGTVNILTAQAILHKKLTDYAAVERKCIEMRKKPLDAYKDIEHLLQYSKALKQYFDKQANTAAILEQSSDEMLAVLDRFIGKKGDK